MYPLGSTIYGTSELDLAATCRYNNLHVDLVSIILCGWLKTTVGTPWPPLYNGQESGSQMSVQNNPQ